MKDQIANSVVTLYPSIIPVHRKPPRWVLVCLVALAAAPPFVSQASGAVVGSFAMFARLDRYHLDVAVKTSGGVQQVRLAELTEHLSRDARRMILPAEGYAASAGQAELVEGGLADLARLVCAVRPDAVSAEVVMSRGPLHGPVHPASRSSLECSKR